MTDYSLYLDQIAQRRGRLTELLTLWANTNSFSHNTGGLERMIELIESDFVRLGGEMRRVELPEQETLDSEGRAVMRPLGRALHIRMRPSAPTRVLLSAHMDTVYPPDHSFQQCVLQDDNILRGPGTADAKGGILVMLAALEALEASPWKDGIGWEVLITPDEEIGSPGSGLLLTQAAEINHLGLVFEPCFLDGNLVGERKGSGNYTAVIRGRSAHAGREPHLGRNAVIALARFILDVNAAGIDGVMVNVGFVEGGGQVNVVPDRAECRFNVRVLTKEDQSFFEEHLDGIVEEINRLEGISMTLRGGFSRPPKPLDDATDQLLTHFAACGSELGLNLSWRPTGGACDGNNLAAAGLPTVDSLGVRGGSMHSLDEFVYLDSLTERARLSALFLMKLGSGDIVWV